MRSYRVALHQLVGNLLRQIGVEAPLPIQSSQFLALGFGRVRLLTLLTAAIRALEVGLAADGYILARRLRSRSRLRRVRRCP